MLPQLLPLRGIYEMLPIQLGPMYIKYMYTCQPSLFLEEAHRLGWVLGAKIHKLTKKAAAAIPTPAARIEVILDVLSGPGLRFCRVW